MLTTGYSRELDGNTHAEECALLKLVASVTPLTSPSSLNASPCLIPSPIRLTRTHTLDDLLSLLATVPSTISTQLSSYYKNNSLSSQSQMSRVSATLVNGLFASAKPVLPTLYTSGVISEAVTPQPLSLSFPRAQSVDGSYMILYTTMEPCSYRLSGKVSCTQLISQCGHMMSAVDMAITRIIVGVHEPDLFVHCDGHNVLIDGGIEVISTSSALRYQCSQLNTHLTRPPSTSATSNDVTINSAIVSSISPTIATLPSVSSQPLMASSSSPSKMSGGGGSHMTSSQSSNDKLVSIKSH